MMMRVEDERVRNSKNVQYMGRLGIVRWYLHPGHQGSVGWESQSNSRYNAISNLSMPMWAG